MNVCRLDGVELVQSRSGLWFHTDAIPQGVDPDHDTIPVDQDLYTATVEARADIKRAVEELILHHAVSHPLSDCQFAQRAIAALKA